METIGREGPSISFGKEISERLNARLCVQEGNRRTTSLRSTVFDTDRRIDSFVLHTFVHRFHGQGDREIETARNSENA